MGAWGAGPFDNDIALDWIIDVEASEGYELFVRAFEAIRSPSSGHLDASACEEAIAAAEVLAEQAGHGRELLTTEAGLQQWMRSMPTPERGLLDDAQQVLGLILAWSELKELWVDNAEYFPQWVASVEDLRKRLGSALRDASPDSPR